MKSLWLWRDMKQQTGSSLFTFYQESCFPELALSGFFMDLPGSLEGRAVCDVSCIDEEVQDQRGSGAFLRLHSEEELSWSQTPTHTPSPSQPLLPTEQQMLLLGA